jgi:uncharacterized paraquat-inducible protein A
MVREGPAEPAPPPLRDTTEQLRGRAERRRTQQRIGMAMTLLILLVLALFYAYLNLRSLR